MTSLNFLRHSLDVVRAAIAAVEPVESVDDVAEIVKALANEREVERLEIPCDALASAIDRLQAVVRVSFFSDVWPRLVRWLLDETHDARLPLLFQEKAGVHNGATRAAVSETKARFLLAHAFVGNLTSFDEVVALEGADALGVGLQHYFGCVSFVDLFTRASCVESVERILCMLMFFTFGDECDANVDVEFERHCAGLPAEQWLACTKPLDAALVTVHRDLMEAVMHDARKPAFCDFANRDLMVHRIIPSCTQEEILFSCAPACLIGLLICERMTEQEIIVIKGVRRFIDYSGYLSTFRVVGPHTRREALFDVLAIDACTFSHWSAASIVRDLNKAHNAWSRAACVSTGAWGCGAFGGDWGCKVIQQVAAASVTGTHLLLSAREGTRAADAEEMLAAAAAARLSVGDAVRILLAYKDAYASNKLTFKDFFVSEARKA